MDQKSPSTPSQQTPPPLSTNSTSSSVKIATPDRLTVPKAFKYPEMYKSPTDQIMSPISKGLLARTKSKKAFGLLPPSVNGIQPHKLQASKFQDLGALRT
ncbi:hypothetical protein Tco_0367351 [Tanacetum coccineum]